MTQKHVHLKRFNSSLKELGDLFVHKFFSVCENVYSAIGDVSSLILPKRERQKRYLCWVQVLIITTRL